MSELTLTLLKVGFLALLWVFVLSSVSVIKSDMFGERVDPETVGQRVKPARSRRPRRGAPTKLVISEGVNAGDSVVLDGSPVVLGRGGDSSIRLDDDYVSTRHARFAPHGDEWYVEDLGSTNGTYIGSQRVTTPTRVATGVHVRLGKTIAELKK